MIVTLADLADHLLDVELELDDQRVPVCPVTVVDLDTGEPDERTVRAAAQASNRVLIGISTATPSPALRLLTTELDTTLCPPRTSRSTDPDESRDPRVVAVPDVADAADQLVAAVRVNPRAALALVHLLRITERLPVAEGLAAESAVYSMLLAGPEFTRWREQTPRREPPVFDRPAVVVERSGDALAITVDRPERRNAFSREVRDGLVEAFELAAADPTITDVGLHGAGPAFGSGGDLDEFGTVGDVTMAHLVRLERSVGVRIHRCRTRTTAHLHGACIGAGIELPSFAGRVRAEPDTVIRLPELAMGLVPGAGGTVSLTRRIDRWRTAYLALSGLPIDAHTALDWGLVDELAPAPRS